MLCDASMPACLKLSHVTLIFYQDEMMIRVSVWKAAFGTSTTIIVRRFSSTDAFLFRFHVPYRRPH